MVDLTSGELAFVYAVWWMMAWGSIALLASATAARVCPSSACLVIHCERAATTCARLSKVRT